MAINIISKKINEVDYLVVQAEIVEELKKQKFNVQQLTDLQYGFKYYDETKAYRSSVTEGNTTSIGEYTKIIQSNQEIYGLNSKIDEQKELLNLVGVYKKFEFSNNINLNEIQKINYDLGKDILHNNFLEYRGSLKKTNNYIPFKYLNNDYIKRFSEPEVVKEDINIFFKGIQGLLETNSYQIFAKFLIIHNELISIHPFVDGNGRTSRVIAEGYIESKGLVPYTPFSEDEKKEYQLYMGKFSVEASELNLNIAYRNFTKYIISVYSENIKAMLKSQKYLIDNS